MAWLLADGAAGIKLRIQGADHHLQRRAACTAGANTIIIGKLIQMRTEAVEPQEAISERRTPMQGKTAFLGAMLIASAAQADAFSESRGVWMRDDGNAKVSIAPCGQQLCATNLWIRDTSKGEQVGDKLVMTLRAASRGTLAGKAYDPKRNLTYSMMLKVTNGGLTTRGCIAGGLLCKNVTWTPAK